MNNLFSFQSDISQEDRKDPEVRSFLSPSIPIKNYFSDSIFSLSKNKPFSTAWVKLAKSLVFILDCTQSSSSFGSVIDRGMRFRAMYDVSLRKHINILYCISCNVLQNNTLINEGDELNERRTT